LQLPFAQSPQLLSEWQQFVCQGLATKTRANYRSAFNKLADFCRAHHLSIAACFPASEALLCGFVTWAARSLTPETIGTYLSGLRSAHIDLGLGDPLLDKLLLERTMRGIRKEKSKPQKRKLPLTVGILSASKPQLSLSTHEGRTIWAALSLGRLWHAAVGRNRA